MTLGRDRASLCAVHLHLSAVVHAINEDGIFYNLACSESCANCIDVVVAGSPQTFRRPFVPLEEDKEYVIGILGPFSININVV